MTDEVLMSVVVVADAPGGPYGTGELSFRYGGRTEDYLRGGDVVKRRDSILAMLGFLAHKVGGEADRITSLRCAQKEFFNVEKFFDIKERNPCSIKEEDQ